MSGTLWTDMFVLGAPVAEKVLRALIVYCFLVVALRLAGKRELAQLNPFDLVVLLTLSNTVQNAIIGNDNSVLGGLIGATTLLAANYLVVRFLFRHERLERLVEGEPSVLIERGRVRADRLEKEVITRAELEEAAHKQGFASLEAVDRAVLESGGAITFVARRPAPEEARHQELLARLDRVLEKIA
jgi:uncharacterized membrane protein YcaP (DUF421 family)